MVSLLLALLTLGGCAGTAAPETVPGLAAWRSPVAGPMLTGGAYLILGVERRLRADLDGDGRREEVVVAPFETAEGDQADSVAVLKRRGPDHDCRLLLNCYAAELRAVRLLRVRGRQLPLLLVATEGGSGSFLSLDAFGWSGQEYSAAAALDGVYQGRYRLMRGSNHTVTGLRLTRSIAGDVNAFPRGIRRETYRWTPLA